MILPRLHKREARGDEKSAEWGVVQVPGLILWKDSQVFTPGGGFCEFPEPIRWSWQFQFTDLIHPQQWPGGEGYPFVQPEDMSEQSTYQQARPILQMLEGQHFPTRTDALQALSAVLALLENAGRSA